MTDLQKLTSMARRMALEEVYTLIPDESDNEISKLLIVSLGNLKCSSVSGAARGHGQLWSNQLASKDKPEAK